MGMCEGCRGVFSVSDMKDGYCEACQISKSNENQIKEENNTCGIISFVLSILSFFVDGIGIIFAIIALICGIKNSKNTFGKIGLIISGIYVTIILLSVIGFVSILNLH